MSECKFEITTKDMGGWVHVYLGRGAAPPASQLALFLAHGLAAWAKKHPQFRIRETVPITINGCTAEFHAWYDQVHFPDSSPMAEKRAIDDDGHPVGMD